MTEEQNEKRLSHVQYVEREISLNEYVEWLMNNKPSYFYAFLDEAQKDVS